MYAWLLPNSSINLSKWNYFLTQTPITNIFQPDRLQCDKLLNGVYDKCIAMNWENERKGENPLTNWYIICVIKINVSKLLWMLQCMYIYFCQACLTMNLLSKPILFRLCFKVKTYRLFPQEIICIVLMILYFQISRGLSVPGEWGSWG